MFGFSGSDPYAAMRPVHTSSGAVGVGQGLETAIVTDAPGAAAVLGARRTSLHGGDPSRRALLSLQLSGAARSDAGGACPHRLLDPGRR